MLFFEAITFGIISLKNKITSVTTTTFKKRINTLFKLYWKASLVVKIAARDAMATFTTVFPIITEIRSFLGSASNVAICFSLGFLLFLKCVIVVAVSEKNAVSEPEKKADIINRIKNAKIKRTVDGSKIKKNLLRKLNEPANKLQGN